MKFDTTQSTANIAVSRTMHANQAWAIDFAMLDLDRRVLVMLVIDVDTLRPVSATVALAIPEDIPTGLERLVRRSGCPREIWIDCHFDRSFELQTFAKRHRISMIYVPMPRTKALTQPILRDLSAFLCGKRFPTLMKLGHEIERWRHSYTAAALPNANE